MVTAPDIPGHKVRGVLGTGGYATVYRAWQMAVGREVAVKVDNRVLLNDRDRRRFVREVTAAGRLSGHPHVIDVYDAGTLADGRPYLVMELCPAGSLNDALRRHGPMSPAQVRDIGIKIADALAASHAAGILHRDIKPANILVNRYGMVGLSDFGLASIVAASGDQTASREALTPAYASPESFRGEEPSAAADLYSLTATLYALLAGRPPRFPADGRSPSPAMIMALHDQPVDDVPGAPADMMGLLRRGLAADPAARPQSAVALRDDLVRLGRRPPAPQAPASQAPAAQAPAPQAPAPQAPAPQALAGPRTPVRQAPMPQAPVPQAPVPQAPVPQAPVPQAPVPQAPVPGAPATRAEGGAARGGPGQTAGVPAPGWDGPRSPFGWTGAPPGLDGPQAPPGLDARPPPPGLDGAPPGLDGPPPGRDGPHAPPGLDGRPSPPGRGPRARAADLAAPGGGRRRHAADAEAPGQRRGWRLVALAAAVIVIAGGAAIVGARFLPHQGGTAGHAHAAGVTGGSPDVFGIPTVTAGCAATSVRVARARCPAHPECWLGMTVTSGAVIARGVPCTQPHYWETFAIGILPSDARTFDQPTLEQNPAISAVCSMRVMLASRHGRGLRIRASSWRVDVLPPTEAAFYSGVRTYRCVGNVLYRRPRTSMFRR